MLLGTLDTYFLETRWPGKGVPKMAAEKKATRSHAAPVPGREASPIPSPRSVSDLAPPASTGSALEQGPDSADFMEDRDLKCHILSLPTREDLECFTARIEKAFTQDIAQLKANTTHLGGRLETLVEHLDDTLPHIALMQEKCTAQEHKMEALISHLDDFEQQAS